MSRLPATFFSERRQAELAEAAPEGLFPPTAEVSDREWAEADWGWENPSGERVNAVTALNSAAFYAGTMTRVLNCAKLHLRAVDEMTLEPLDRQPPWATRAPCWGMTSWEFASRYWLSIARQGFAAFHILTWDRGLPDMVRPLGDQFVSFNPSGRAIGGMEVQYNPDPARSALYHQTFQEWMGPGSPLYGDPASQAMVVRYVDDATTGGVNVVRVARDVIGRALAIQRHATSFFGKGAASAPLISLAGDEWGDDEGVAEFGGNYAKSRRNPANRHLPAFVKGQARGVNTRFNSRETQMVEAGDQSVRDAGSRLHGISGQLLGENMTAYGTAVATMNRLLHSLVLQPMLTCMESAWNWCLPEGQVARYDTADLLHADPDQWYETVTMLVEGGIVTVNEGRSMLRRGLGDVEGGDELRKPAPAGAIVGGGDDPIGDRDGRDEDRDNR